MKPQIENQIFISEDTEVNLTVYQEFCFIINHIISSNTVDMLKAKLNKRYAFIDYGFGAGHFWACQKNDPDKKRIIFVEL